MVSVSGNREAFFQFPIVFVIQLWVGWDSAVGIATSYGLDSLGIEFRWGARFSSPVQTGPGAHPASYTTGTSHFPGGKAAGAWRWPTTPSSTEVKERVEPYLYSFSGPSWPVRANFTFTFSCETAKQFCLVVRVAGWDKRYRLYICLGVKLCTFKSWFSFFIEEVDKSKDNSTVAFLLI
jgi:hypothetical protein